jgi:molecular chaperone DnaK (HSP70)
MNLVEQLATASAGSPPKRVLGIDLGTTNSTVAQVHLPRLAAGSLLRKVLRSEARCDKFPA